MNVVTTLKKVLYTINGRNNDIMKAMKIEKVFSNQGFNYTPLLRFKNV